MLNYNHASDIWVKAAQEMMDPPQGVKLPWWPTFNKFTGGLRPHELTLLCAPTGAGKTQLLANVSAQLALQEIPQFVAPVETGDVDFMIRMVSALHEMECNSGDALPPETLTAITKRWRGVLAESPIYISTYDNRVNAEEMLTMLKYQHQNYGCRVALLDNLNFFLEITSQQLERAEMDYVMHEFVMLAKKLPIHIVLVVHPRKTENGRVVSEFDIKGSSTAVQEASNVILFNRPDKNESRNSTDRELVFRKIRKRGRYVGQPLWLGYSNGRLLEAVK